MVTTLSSTSGNLAMTWSAVTKIVTGFLCNFKEIIWQ
jgi:hypothetical protein